VSNPERTLLGIANHIARQHANLKSNLSEMLHNGMGEWVNRGFSVPCPKFVKDAVLVRQNLSNSTWIETGTAYGDTTQMLAQIATKVYTIEPEPSLFEKARQRFSKNSKVVVVNDISENALSPILKSVEGNICFWLDGHYSGGVTYAGPNDTPLVEELIQIETQLNRFPEVMIAIDDIRYCGKHHLYGEYPSLDYLVDWSRKNSLDWHIEYDIFIAKTP